MANRVPFLVAEMGSNVDPFTLHIYASLLRRNAPSSVSGPRRPLRQPSAAVGSSARPAASRRQRAHGQPGQSQATKANATTRAVIAEIQRTGKTTLAAIAQ